MRPNRRMLLIGGLFATAATMLTGCPVDPPVVNNLAAGNSILISVYGGPNQTFSNPGGLQTLGADAATRGRDYAGVGSPVNDQYVSVDALGAATLVDGAGTPLLALGTLYDVMFSLDGSSLAVAGPSPAGPAITIYDLPTLTARRTIAPTALTITTGFDLSRDGAEVVYRNADNGISVAATSGATAPVEVFPPAADCSRPRLTGDHRAAAYCAGRDIRTVNADGTGSRTLVTGVTGSSNNLIGEIGTGRIIYQRTAANGLGRRGHGRCRRSGRVAAPGGRPPCVR